MDHLGAGRADVAPLDVVAFVRGRDAYGIEARLATGQFGGYRYRGQINVQASAGYTGIGGLHGTRFAASDPDSWSGYLLPWLLVSDTTGMTPTTFFGQVDFVGGHLQVIREVYTGTADCGASFEDARGSVGGEYPDVFDVVEVLTYTEYVPTGPTWAFRQDLDPTLAQSLTIGIMTVGNTEAGKDQLWDLFGWRPSGITTTHDGAPGLEAARRVVHGFGLSLAYCHFSYLSLVLRDS